MKLRHSPSSPFVRKVMVLAYETGLEPKIERLPTVVAPNKPNLEVQRENPLIKIPSLLTDDGQVLFDSRVICEYLDSLHNGPKIFPPASTARWVALRQQALGDGIMDAAVGTRYETFLRPKELLWKDWVEAQMRRVRGGLAALDGKVNEGALAGPLTIGQITVGCALGYLDFRYPNEAWRDHYSALAKWYEVFAKRPSMQATVPPNA
jgi:glutathione S-transferase